MCFNASDVFVIHYVIYDVICDPCMRREISGQLTEVIPPGCLDPFPHLQTLYVVIDIISHTHHKTDHVSHHNHHTMCVGFSKIIKSDSFRSDFLIRQRLLELCTCFLSYYDPFWWCDVFSDLSNNYLRFIPWKIFTPLSLTSLYASHIISHHKSHHRHHTRHKARK